MIKLLQQKVYKNLSRKSLIGIRREREELTELKERYRILEGRMRGAASYQMEIMTEMNSKEF